MNEREQLGFCRTDLPPGCTLNDIDERFGDAEDIHELRRRLWREREANRKRRLRRLMRGKGPVNFP